MGNLRVAFSGEWFDLLGSVEQSTGTAALSREQYGDGTGNSGHLMRFWRHDQNDEVQLDFQLNHDVLIPGEARFHVHLIPMSLPVAGVSDVVRWRYHYAIASPWQELPRTGWTTADISKTIAVTDQYKHVVHSIVSIPIPAGTAASSILFVRLLRLGTDGADTYSVDKATSGGGLTAAANLAFIGIDVHCQRSRAGTRGEFS